MYNGTLHSGDIILAFERHVPGSYVRDYRDQGGFLTICKDYKDLQWNDQTTTRKVYRKVPATTLVSIPRGQVPGATQYKGLALHQPGWRLEFRKAMRHLTVEQMRRITKELHVGEVFPGIR